MGTENPDKKRERQRSEAYKARRRMLRWLESDAHKIARNLRISLHQSRQIAREATQCR